MPSIPLDPPLSVSHQITGGDIPHLKAQGVTTIINNRPDGEEPGQVASAEASRIAAENGVEYRFIPVTSETMTDDAVRAFADALKEARARGGDILAHCRSGTRSTVLWAMAEAMAGRDIDDLIGTAAAAGYDIRAVRPRLEKLKAGG